MKSFNLEVLSISIHVIFKIVYLGDHVRRNDGHVQEVPQFEFLDSPLNQHDLDSHVPIDGYGELNILILLHNFVQVKNKDKRILDE